MQNQLYKTFKSDNYSGVHLEIMSAIFAANVGHATAYMQDEYTIQANTTIEDIFGKCKILYCFNGTSANVLALRACLRAYQAVICANSAHIHNNETAAPESIIGCKLITLTAQDGKITAQQIKEHLAWSNGIHSPQAKVVSITQPTEYGTTYSIEELKAIKEVCLAHDLYLHIDGCRIYNAAVHLNCNLAAISSEIGVDILSLGGTKNGAMMAEAVLIFNPDLSNGVEYLQKNTLQLYSKNRYMAVQFTALFSNNLWKRNAENANKMTKLLATELEKIATMQLAFPCQTNQLFVQTSLTICKYLEQKGFCYILSEDTSKQTGLIRFVCSYDTQKEDIQALIACIQEIAK
jgi:threonine aldolase